MSTVIRIIKRGNQTRADISSAVVESPVESSKSKIVSSVKSWIAESRDRRRTEADYAAGLARTKKGNSAAARGYVGLLDWYTVSIAIFATVILAAHGATYLTLKTEGPVHDRCAIWARYLWVAVAPLFLAISIETFVVRPDLPGQAIHNPFWYLGLLVVAASIVTIISGLSAGRVRRTLIGSTFMLVGLLVTGAAAIFPVMLYSTLAPENSLTAYNVAAGPSSFLFAWIWWPVGFALATFYFVFISRRYAGKVSVRRDSQGFY